MARHRLSRDRLPALLAPVPWVPMLVGIAIMAGYMIYALMLRVGYQPSDETDLVVPAPPATTGVPEVTGPTGEADPVGGGEQRRAELPATSAPPPEPSPDPPPADVTGEYGIDATFDDVFIGRVVIVNGSGGAQDWTVLLAFPSNVGTLNTFWVDGTPQPTLREEGDRYMFTSTVPVEGDSQVILKFHFDRSGEDVPPTTCTVNGTTCT